MANFMTGKKKFTMFLITAATALINSYVADPDQAETFIQLATQYIPTLVVFAGALFGVNRETKVDVEREKTKQAEATTMQTEAAKVIKEADILQPIAEEAYFDPFDHEAFAKKLEARAARTYLEVTPATVYFASLDKGKSTRCQHLDQALAYWDFLVTRVRLAFTHMYGFPYEEADKHLADDNKDCPYYSVENMARQKGIHFWNMLRQVRWISRKQAELESLALTDIEWKARLSPTDQTLFGVGNLAYEMLKHDA